MEKQKEFSIIECTSRIQHLTSTQLRSEALFKLLEIELKNSQNPNLVQAAKTGLVEMIDAVKKIQFHEELRHALELLSVYIKTNNWSEIIPIDNDSRDYSNNIIEIQEILKKSIFCKEDCS